MRHSPLTLILLVFFLFSILVLTSLFRQQSFLEISSEGYDSLLLPLAIGEEFTIEYIHSVARTPIRDVFVGLATPENGKTIRFLRTEYSSFGAGLPTESFGRFSHNNGLYINEGIELFFTEIPLRVGSFANHQINGEGITVFLNEYFPAGKLVVLRPVEIMKIKVLFYERSDAHGGKILKHPGQH